MGRIRALGWLGLAWVLLGGCAATGEVRPLDIRADPPETVGQMLQGDALRVAVVAFEDKRADQKHVGTRTHIFGGETYFDLPANQPATTATEVMADYLRRSGWAAWVAKPNVTIPGDEAELIITGDLVDFSVRAKSRFLSTEITSAVRLTLHAKNVADGSVVNLSTFGSASEPVIWFDPDDVQEHLNEALKASVEKFLANTKVENRLLRTN